MSYFESVEMLPDDPILGLGVAFAEDSRSQKVNLGIGAYKNADGNPYVLSCVRKAEAKIIEKKLDKEYQPILGNADYLRGSLELVFGEDSPLLSSGRIAAAQTIGCTGALRVGGDFLFDNKICGTIHLSDPTWPNHASIFSKSGFKIERYSYYSFLHRTIDFSEMLDSIKKIPSGNALLIQPCCHNPTGLTPSNRQWKEIAELIQLRKLVPFFDFSYQGLDKGLSEDAQVLRHFAERGVEMLVGISHSKNFGLYGERAGLLAVVCEHSSAAKKVESQLRNIIRGSYSMPPLHGARIVAAILQDDVLRVEWERELESMRDRIKGMRADFVSGLRSKGTEGAFDHLETQAGMFSFSGLNKNQIQMLREDYGIYMPSNGRLNIAGLNKGNMNYVINSILSVIKS